MALKAHTFPGLSNPVYLPDDIKVEIKIIPAGNGNVRSNTKRAAADVKFVTRHETANFRAGADADMHYRWLMGNPSPAVGFNAVNDDTKIIVLTPYNEVTWAAGNAVGNLTSDHHELCVNQGIDHAKARRIAAALDAGVLHARRLQPWVLVTHHYWWGKNCPQLMIANNNAIWNGSYYPMVKKFHADIVAHVDGGSLPAPEPPKPVGKATFTLRFDTYIRSSPGFWDTKNDKSNVIKLMEAGTTGEVISGPVEVNGVQFYDLKIDGFGTGWLQDQVLHTLDIKRAS